MATLQDKSTNASAQSAAMPVAPPDVADAFSQTRLLIIAAGKIADGGDETHDYALRSVISAAEEKFTVALDWFEARAWEEKMVAEGRKAAPEPTARQDETIADRVRDDRELVQVADNINEARYLVEAAWMAAGHLDDDDDKNAIQSVLSIARDDKLNKARDLLNVALGVARERPARTRTPVDPVFAAIKRHKTAWDALPAVLAAVDDIAAEKQGRKITASDIEAHRQVDEAVDAALDEFEASIPTTMAGLRAALEYAVEIDRDGVPQHVGGRIAPTLLKSPVFAVA